MIFIASLLSRRVVTRLSPYLITIMVKNRCLVFVSHPLKICSRYLRTRRAKSKWRAYYLDWRRVSEGWRSNLWLLFVYTVEGRGVEDTRNATPLSRTDEQYVISGRAAYLGAFIFNTFANRRLVEEGA